LESGIEGNIWMLEGGNDRVQKLRDGEIRNTCFLSNIITMIKSRRMKLAKIVETSTHIFMVLRYVGAKQKNNMAAQFR
jgi:hypothetical protein